MGRPNPSLTAADCHSGTAMMASNFPALSPPSMVVEAPPPTHSTWSLTARRSAALMFLHT